MYYIVYGFFYIVSLLPFAVLYCISNAIYFFVYYVFGYRKKVVMGNLAIAFPGKKHRSKNRYSETVLQKFY